MNERLSQALNECPSSLANALLPYLNSDTFHASFSATEVIALQQSSGLSSTELALALLPLAASYAFAPLSDFKVGAIAHGASGRWYLGANMEFITTPLQQTVHAEQSAINHAWISGETRLNQMTVNYTPCGHCRQFMNELNCAEQLLIQLPDTPPRTLPFYLPHAFGPKDLGITHALFDPQIHAMTMHHDPLINAALSAASQSYAPYTHAYSAVALLLDTGQRVTGRYAENAAFNPSLPPLQSALIILRLQGYDPSSITRAVFVEIAGAAISQKSATLATLSALGCHDIETLTFTTNG
ncbi:cytidine deaminase [Rosenbergiella australiborealis]|uniref:Cytidine deaminase n=1 Tax=Rosenbergiella australiborealis TaxID=1544696 RepID=A0ABS5T3C0_9GAMM|nr:cytidine deaminase [Rosenbergiella australiborealis]MBT0726850.1 cytidine deaminase [Rosenbergiella australiborealis]